MIWFLLLTLAVLAMFAVPQFGRVPHGEALERVKLSPNYRDGHFCNEQPTVLMSSDKGFLKNLGHFMRKNDNAARNAYGRVPQQALPVVRTDLHALDRSRDLYVWFGHSSYLLQLSGRRILVDPVLENRGLVSLILKPFKGTEVYSADDMPDIDYLVITHDHWDHLDYITVRRLRNRVGHVVCPLGVGSHLRFWGYDAAKIIETDWEDEYCAGDLRFVCLPTRHFSGRTLRRDKTLWASYLVEGKTRSVYIGGDGGYDDRFERIAARYGRIDFAVFENGQYNGEWRYIHMMPEDLERAVRELNPRRAVTVHNSKFALSIHSWREPLDMAFDMAQRDSLPVQFPLIGEVVSLDDSVAEPSAWWKSLK